MRRILIGLICCLLLVTGVSAAGTVSQLQTGTIVNSDGTCEVTVTLQLKLDSVPASLMYPLPGNAKDISLNGGIARTQLADNVRYVNLSGGVQAPGTYTFSIHYSLPDAIKADKKGQLSLTLELLSGFDYPISAMDFSITLPGEPEDLPTFLSTYYQESVDTLMDLQILGNTISGTFTRELNDHESLTMTLAVSEALFPQPISKKWSLSTDDIAMYILALAALGYWLLTLRSLPPRRIRRTNEPEGLTAGELGCCLTGQGIDLTMLVVCWAQMGYLLIQLDDNGRVLLHKRMDMGNERSDYEIRLFRSLFGKRKTVDGTGYHYARLFYKAARQTPGLGRYFEKRSGNPNIFRVLVAGVGIFSGISLASAMATDTIWQILLGILLSICTAVVSWQIQSAAGMVHVRQKQRLYIALASSGIWLILGIWAGDWGVTVFALICQWLAGFAAAYGGRRSELGRQSMAEILGLRRHLRSVSKDELRRILSTNPDYYYNLAPYAMALGVDRAFARQMGNLRLPECTYLTTGMDGHLTAREWNQLLRDTAAALDDRQKNRPFNKR